MSHCAYKFSCHEAQGERSVNESMPVLILLRALLLPERAHVGNMLWRGRAAGSSRATPKLETRSSCRAVREPDKQALIERIVSLQRAAARRAERCEFLEEHARQLTDELRTKVGVASTKGDLDHFLNLVSTRIARLLRHLLPAMPAQALSSTASDSNKGGTDPGDSPQARDPILDVTTTMDTLPPDLRPAASPSAEGPDRLGPVWQP
ncbi:hypothetical protein MSG28_014654 [Choristoneura fumiferana]|uniref:Uncharacterized protein n=1 Tax=Choristoneura fumiferana TaxID=7141 RepID=A0ACC0JS79_CHOFU|nr:hypothetical protein MSG28_014654 [Choristoneura fumiferana]